MTFEVSVEPLKCQWNKLIQNVSANLHGADLLQSMQLNDSSCVFFHFDGVVMCRFCSL